MLVIWQSGSFQMGQMHRLATLCLHGIVTKVWPAIWLLVGLI